MRNLPVDALFLCLALILAWIETLIPMPIAIPGLKIGLANIVVLAALYLLGPFDAILISLSRVVLSSILFASPSAMLFSSGGAIASLIVMILLMRSNRFGVIGVSVSGAVSHNIGQILVAVVITQTLALFSYLPIIIIGSLFAGILIALITFPVIASVKKSVTNSVVSVILIFVMTIPMLSLTSCATGSQNHGTSGSDNYVEKTEYLLDTVCTVRLYEPLDDDLAEDAMDICRALDEKLNMYNDKSEIFRLNHSEGRATVLSADSLEVIKLGLKYSEISSGLFDITIGSVSELWSFPSAANEAILGGADNMVNRIPDIYDVTQALKFVDYRNVVLNQSSVALGSPHARIDLGSLAQGFIADKMKEFLVIHGVRDAIIDLGGNIVTIGDKKGEGWVIGVDSLIAKSEKSGEIEPYRLRIDESKTIVTSGTFQRGFTYDGRFYHHILDPGTGYPVKTDIKSVTVIMDDSADADAITTICVLLGSERAKAFLSGHRIDAVLLLDDDTVHTIGTVDLY